MNKNKIYDIGKVPALIAFGLLIKSFSDNTDISYCALPAAVPLLMAGGGIISSILGKKKSKAKAPPPPVDIYQKGTDGKSITDKQLEGTVGYYENALPQFLDLESRYSPEFLKQGFEIGGQGATGFKGLRDLAAGGEAKTMAGLREEELGLKTDQAGLTRGLMESLSPEQAAQVKRMQDLADQAAGAEGNYAGRMNKALGTYGIRPQDFKPTVTSSNLSPTIQAAEQDAAMANQMAQEAYARRGTLSAQEQRSAQQTAREAAQSAGRLGGNAAIAAEIQNREAALAGRRAQASQAGQQAFDQRQNLANLRFQEQQGLFNQRFAGAGQTLAEQQALFNQGITGATTKADLQRAGLGQLQDIEKMRMEMRGEAGSAATNAYNAAGGFYTTPGLNLLNQTPQSYTTGANMANIGLQLGQTLGANLDYNMPLGFAQQMAGAQNQYNQAVYQTNLANQQAKAQMFSNIGSSLLGAGLAGMGGVSGGNFSSFLGGGNFGNAGTAFGNIGREAMGMPLRAYTV